MAGNNSSHIVKKKSVVETIMDTIIGQIVSGKYPPGAKLPNEYELISELNVSRNSLREAIKIMCAMGLVEVKHGDGTYVCSQVNPSVLDNVVYSMVSCMSSSNDLIELRQIFDDTTVRLAIEKITPEELDKLEGNIRAMRTAIQKHDIATAQELDFQFHMDLIECSKNVLYIRVSKGLYTIFKNSIQNNIFLEGVDSLAPTYHQNILNCIKNRDYRLVQQVVADSLITWRKGL